MPAYPWTDIVDIRGQRSGHTQFARGIKVQIWRLGIEPLLVQDQAALKWRYAIQWDPRDTMDDGSRISEGDVLLWDVYDGQNLTIGDVFIDPSATFTQFTGYFMPVDTSGPSGQ